MGSFLATWHVLPVFLDVKIAVSDEELDLLLTSLVSFGFCKSSRCHSSVPCLAALAMAQLQPQADLQSQSCPVRHRAGAASIPSDAHAMPWDVAKMVVAKWPSR